MDHSHHCQCCHKLFQPHFESIASESPVEYGFEVTEEVGDEWWWIDGMVVIIIGYGSGHVEQCLVICGALKNQNAFWGFTTLMYFMKLANQCL